MAKATGAQNQAVNRFKTIKKRASKLTLSVLAVFVTLIPLFSAGIWVKNTFFSDPRHTTELKQIPASEQPVKLFDEPIISITFDDGWESIYSSGAPVFEKYGIRTTQYVLSGAFDYYNYLSKEQMLSLQKAGHDIQSHTVNHNDLTSLNDEDLSFELKRSKSDLSKLLGKEVTEFASPLNRYNNKVIGVVEEAYRSHRNTEADIVALHENSFNLATNFDPHQINAFSVRRTTTVDQIKQYIAAAKERNAWIVLIYHQVGDSDEDYYAVTKQALDDQMSAIASSGIRIATVDEVMDVYYAKQEAK